MTTPTEPTTASASRRVTVRYFGGAKAVAGLRVESVYLPDATTIDELVSHLAASHGPGMTRILTAASLLLNEHVVHNRTMLVPDGAVIDVLPPVAGG